MYHGRFKGTHYEAGYHYGELIRKNGHVIDSCPTFEITQEMTCFTEQCLPIYEKYYPEVVDEIYGLSDGQGTDRNILMRILFSMYCFGPNHHCTCFAYADDDNIFLCRNSDFLVRIEKLYMNCLYALDGVYAFNGNTTAYIEMEDGINKCGLAVGFTFIYPHIRKPGINAGMLVRYLLEKCATTDEAIEAIKRLPRASAQTITLADRSGKIAVVESNPEKVVFIYPKNGCNYVATANNFNSKEMAKYRTPSYIDDWRADERYKTVNDAFSRIDTLGIEDAKDILSGKYGFMCQYDRKKDADTVWSVIYDVKNRRTYRVEGNPMRKAFEEDTRIKY